MAGLRGWRLVTTGAGGHRSLLLPHRCAKRTSQPPFLSLDAGATDPRDAFSAEALAAAVRLMNKYSDVPMDFPDATLVWTAESAGADGILTLDLRGFASFRFGKNQRFKLLLDL
jgi:hypothetical protein